MKRGIIAVALLVSVAATAAISGFVLSKKIDDLSLLAEKAYYSEDRAKDLQAEWEKSQTLFSVFLGHNHFENLNSAIETLQYVDGDEYTSACADALVCLDELRDHISFSAGNLLCIKIRVC